MILCQGFDISPHMRSLPDHEQADCEVVWLDREAEDTPSQSLLCSKCLTTAKLCRKFIIKALV